MDAVRENHIIPIETKKLAACIGGIRFAHLLHVTFKAGHLKTQVHFQFRIEGICTYLELIDNASGKCIGWILWWDDDDGDINKIIG